MKAKIAQVASTALMVIGSLLIFTNSYYAHRPETPEELLK